MKYSTLKVRSKALYVPVNIAEDIRNNKSYVILPLLSKNILNSGDYLYLKEKIGDAFTTKETAKTFVEIVTNKVVNIQELTDEDLSRLNLNSETIQKYYTAILDDMISNTIKSSVSANKLINNYGYECNPTIQLVELNIITPSD